MLLISLSNFFDNSYNYKNVHNNVYKTYNIYKMYLFIISNLIFFVG